MVTHKLFFCEEERKQPPQKRHQAGVWSTADVNGGRLEAVPLCLRLPGGLETCSTLEENNVVFLLCFVICLPIWGDVWRRVGRRRLARTESVSDRGPVSFHPVHHKGIAPCLLFNTLTGNTTLLLTSLCETSWTETLGARYCNSWLEKRLLSLPSVPKK